MSPTDNPLPLALLFGAAALMAALFAMGRQTVKAYLVVVVLALIAGGIFAIDSFVVTERERVEARINSLVRNFEAQNLDATLEHISQRALLERALVTGGIQVLHVPQPLAIKDISVALQNEDSVAISRFRVNGTVELNGRSLGHQPSMWEVTWRKEGGEWKATKIQELDPIREEPLSRVEQMFGSSIR